MIEGVDILLGDLNGVYIHETRRVGIWLAFVGGFLDVYTYLLRGGVFANAQTGNMVLMMLQISKGQWLDALYYIVPVLAFFTGVVVTGFVKLHERWHEQVLMIECLLLFLIGFYPLSWPPMIVNITISFICAMQVSSFRTLRGAAYATTVCTGNLRSAAEQLTVFYIKHDIEAKRRGLNYFIIILSFCMGALIGALLIKWLTIYSVWICAFILMGIVFILKKENTTSDSSDD